MKMKIIKWLALPIAAVTLLAGCAAQKANQAPELRGINDKSCLVNSRLDLLSGVSALDAEDGDITPSLQISITPEVEVVDGYATFTQTGRYEIVYKIEDSAHLSARTTAYVTVEEREVYMSNVHTNGFSVEAHGGANIIADGINGSVYSFKFNGGEISEDVRLTRSYTLVSGVEYNFAYYISSDSDGKVVAAADGEVIAELAVNKGENVLKFTHSLPVKSADGDDTADISLVELWLGELEGEVECSLTKVETVRAEMDDFVRTTEAFDFNGKAYANFHEGADGEISVSENGKSCSMQITKTAEKPEKWHANAFLNTGVAVNSGYDYEISFDLLSEDGSDVDICFNRTRGKEKSLGALYGVRSGRVTYFFTADDFKEGSLWVQIQAGNKLNKITVSDLSVRIRETRLREYKFYPFGQFHADGINGNVKTEYGKIIYTAQSFGSADWNNNEISSPEFGFMGAAKNYVITFKAKASKPLRCAFIAHDAISDEWSTFVWKEIGLTEQETQFSVQCDDKDLAGRYRFLWQFGNAENANLTDVTVEISDIKICNKSELDG